MTSFFMKKIPVFVQSHFVNIKVNLNKRNKINDLKIIAVIQTYFQ